MPMIGENESIGYEKLLGQGPNHLTFGILIEQENTVMIETKIQHSLAGMQIGCG